MNREGSAIRRRVGDEKDQQVDPSITQLQCEAALKRLEVEQPGLCLASCALAAQLDQRVPRAPIAGQGHRDLGLPPHGAWQPGPEPLEEREVRRVADRIAIRVGPQDEPQPNGLGGPRRLVDGQRAISTALDPAELRVRHLCRGTDRPLTEPCSQTCGPDLRSELTTAVSHRAPRIQDWVTPCAHGATLDLGPHRSLTQSLGSRLEPARGLDRGASTATDGKGRGTTIEPPGGPALYSTAHRVAKSSARRLGWRNSALPA